jgi:hypothetical protein
VSAPDWPVSGIYNASSGGIAKPVRCHETRPFLHHLATSGLFGQTLTWPSIHGQPYVNFRGNNDPEIENPPDGRALKKKTEVVGL